VLGSASTVTRCSPTACCTSLRRSFPCERIFPFLLAPFLLSSSAYQSLCSFTIAILGLPVSTLLLLHACYTPVSSASAGLNSRPSPISTVNFTKSSSTTELARHYTQVQFSLAAQIPLPNRPFFGLVTKGEAENKDAPFDSLELTSRRSSAPSKEGITIRRDTEVTVVTLPKNGGGDWVEEVEEVEKW